MEAQVSFYYVHHQPSQIEAAAAMDGMRDSKASSQTESFTSLSPLQWSPFPMTIDSLPRCQSCFCLATLREIK